MSGCMLRVGGDGFDAEKFLAGAKIQGISIHPRRGAKVKIITDAFNADVPGPESISHETQIQDALAFLEKYQEDLLKLKEMGGGKWVEFDFYCSFTPDFEVHTLRWPPQLLQRMGELGVELAATVYPPSVEDLAEYEAKNG